MVVVLKKWQRIAGYHFSRSGKSRLSSVIKSAEMVLLHWHWGVDSFNVLKVHALVVCSNMCRNIEKSTTWSELGMIWKQTYMFCIKFRDADDSTALVWCGRPFVQRLSFGFSILWPMVLDSIRKLTWTHVSHTGFCSSQFNRSPVCFVICLLARRKWIFVYCNGRVFVIATSQYWFTNSSHVFK